jgi:hypothetical protein
MESSCKGRPRTDPQCIAERKTLADATYNEPRGAPRYRAAAEPDHKNSIVECVYRETEEDPGVKGQTGPVWHCGPALVWLYSFPGSVGLKLSTSLSYRLPLAPMNRIRMPPPTFSIELKPGRF